MKRLKQTAIFTGILIIIGSLFLGFKIGKKYYTAYQIKEELTNTILDKKIIPNDYQEAKNLKNGQILSKKLFKLLEIPPIWNRVSENGSLLSKYKHLDKINFYLVVYKSDSSLINGIIAEPKKKGEFPVIIFNRGGNKEIGKVAKAKTLYSLLEFTKLVEEGYVLIASCYRENDEFGGEDINDVLYLTETVKEIEKADSNRIGMLGWSRGGMMSYLALQKSDLITTAVIGNGPTDLFSLIIDRPEMETNVCAKLIPDYKRNKEKELKKRSVIYWADELNKNSSVLILCATNDKRVNPEQAKKVAKKLTDINYDFELKEFETDHKFSGKKDELNELLIHWFKDKL